MEKRLKLKYFFLLAVLFCIVALSNSSAQMLNASISNTIGEDNIFQLYNITINNTNIPVGINFTQVNITFPYIFNITSPTGTTTSGSPSFLNGLLFSWTNTSVGGFISNGTLGYFWLNVSANQTGTFNVTVTTLDTAGNINSTNLAILINDTVPPLVSFISPTDGLTTSSINYPYIQANVTSSDFGTGVNTTTVYLYNSTELLVSSYTNKSGYYFVNFTNLSSGDYFLNATSVDLNGNKNSTPTLTINITLNSCTPNWACVSWGTCANNTETCTSINDTDSCGITFNGTYPTQTCNSTCNPYWSCSDWSPAICSNGSQTRNCTDLNNCVQPEVQTQTCVLGSSVNTSQQQSGQTGGASSASLVFYWVVGFIILVAVAVVFVLMRLKKKSSYGNFGNSNNQSPGYRSYPPPGGPSSGNNLGYPSQSNSGGLSPANNFGYPPPNSNY